MIRLFIPALVLLGIVVFWLMRTSHPLVRGVADSMLISPAKPAVAVAPGPGLHLVDARRADVASSASMGSALANPSVGMWYALYADEKVPARLVALMAVLETPYAWPLDASAGPHEFRVQDEHISGLLTRAATYVLTAEHDPWHAEEEAPQWARSLTRRYTFLDPLQGFKLMVEYREPLPELPLPIKDSLPELAAFEARAAKAFQFIRPIEGLSLPRPSGNLPYPPAGVRRTELARYLGPIDRPAR